MDQRIHQFGTKKLSIDELITMIRSDLGKYSSLFNGIYIHYYGRYKITIKNVVIQVINNSDMYLSLKITQQNIITDINIPKYNSSVNISYDHKENMIYVVIHT